MKSTAVVLMALIGLLVLSGTVSACMEAPDREPIEDENEPMDAPDIVREKCAPQPADLPRELAPIGLMGFIVVMSSLLVVMKKMS